MIEVTKDDWPNRSGYDRPAVRNLPSQAQGSSLPGQLRIHPGVFAADGEEQDAYVLGVGEPVAEFTGRVVAIIHRFDDIEEKWVVAPEGMTFTKEEIMQQVHFQEQYFKSEVRM